MDSSGELMFDEDSSLSIVVFGASGDLAARKIFPTLFTLYHKGTLPAHVIIVGYARSDLTQEQFRAKISKNFGDKAKNKQQEFLSHHCFYHRGKYDSVEDVLGLHEFLSLQESKSGKKTNNRIFYFAVHPHVFIPLSHRVRSSCMANAPGFTRVVIEKPFGKDSETCQTLVDTLSSLFSEDQVFRMDHYLGKEMVQNLMVLRFANSIFESLWNYQHIASVMVTFKEDIGVDDRGSYFDEYGIIRDVMQNHLLQILALIGMEPPKTLDAETIHNEKVKLLKSISPIRSENLAVGQFGPSQAGWAEKGYLDASDVKGGSRTPTYAAGVVFVENERWQDVPFVLRCGKGLDERKTEIVIQFKPTNSPIFRAEQQTPNELVIRVQPDESVSMKLITKRPGLTGEIVESEMDLSYKKKFVHSTIPDAYERLFLDIIKGDQSLFVRNDELMEAWRIFTPSLRYLENQKVQPDIYPFGSVEPENAKQLVEKYGFKYRGGHASR